MAAKSSTEAGTISRRLPSPISTRAPSRKRRQPGGHAFALDGKRILRGLAVVRNRPGRAHDRLIAGAAAEIALQRLLDGRDRRLGRAHPQRIERHHEARRAEAALRAVEVDHRLLHRMQLAGFAAQMLDRHDMAAVERAEEADAGVDALIDELAAGELADQHGAGAAIALRAAFLGAAQRTAQPQIVEQRLVRADVGSATSSPLRMKRSSVRTFGFAMLSFPCRSNSRRARPAAAHDSAWPPPCRSGSGSGRGTRVRQGTPCRAQIVARGEDELVLAGREARRPASNGASQRPSSLVTAAFRCVRRSPEMR